jgi:hypothetical protein
MRTYDRKAQVPATLGTHPKVCPKCDRRFACAVRLRQCDNCRRNDVKVRTPSNRLNCEFPQVDGIEISEFHPDSRVAATVIDVKDDYPRTWRNVLKAIRWEMLKSDAAGPGLARARAA